MFERISERSAGRGERKEDSRLREQRVQRPGGAEQRSESRKPRLEHGCLQETAGNGSMRDTVDST